MFDRIRRTVAVLGGKDASADWQPAVINEIDNHADAISKRAAGEEAPPKRNPVVAFFEVMFVAWLVVKIIHPAIRELLTTSETAHVFLLVIFSIPLYWLVDALQKQLNAKISLRFLDPYFGRRIDRTVKALRG